MRAVVVHDVGDIRLEEEVGKFVPLRVPTMRSAIAAYAAFDEHRPAWMRVELRPAA